MKVTSFLLRAASITAGVDSSKMRKFFVSLGVEDRLAGSIASKGKQSPFGPPGVKWVWICEGLRDDICKVLQSKFTSKLGRPVYEAGKRQNVWTVPNLGKILMYTYMKTGNSKLWTIKVHSLPE